ncbi:MAG: preprotein translocase subunit SecA [Candidatus Kerfeldbacteria bacterium CG08_land_8_20_14_0_20_43_14]|uniref:Protein translocase subunit SecA n=1 Tax=Candidatus Kerfeldbacteria bacterium CG08_land_8_20_14_0_20_43_14 TaxID=2014246 RepID=A0A2H0YR24_9BACT|nr:MAG: preprotein translocase subunit SecA [Candidatus Kerfeldbacteria bacterium CG08_land_8_20_14_0_20_43_14]
MGIINKIFGNPNDKVVKDLEPLIRQINALENEVKDYPDSKFSEKTKEFYGRFLKGESLDKLLPETFALVREAAKRTLGQRHFDVQLMGGIVLHQGRISEMRTGEGKTLVATLPAYLNAITGKGVHVVTVNDYLAKRDTRWMGQIYHFLGLSVGTIQHEAAFVYDPDFEGDEFTKNLRPVDRTTAYKADITYGTNNEFGFDYLRDNMVPDPQYLAQRELVYAIVDEVDSILIDEARTPLIISGPSDTPSEQYYRFADLVQRLEEGPDYNVDEKLRASTLTEEGISKIEGWLGIGNIYQAGGVETVHHIEQALKAHALFKRDRDYVVKDNEVIIVDEFTGRLMHGRRYSEGLHQAIEAKEHVEIKQESQTLATITFQNYFRMYKKLAGMTGTAATEAEEFSKIYNLEVVSIPTNKPMVRKDSADSVYKTEMGKYEAIVRDIKIRHDQGQPILIGTISIAKNEMLSQLLQREGIPHELLNAKNHEKEAGVISQAGRLGAVTVATNMAGRGVDIILGGNPLKPEEAKKVKELGGLHVIGTERHESRRIDNQLRGRSGRQGDPGSSQFFLSLEDDLMRIFGGDRVKSLMERLHVPEDMPIENKMISRSIEGAQKKVEGHNFDIRKHLVEYDDVINKHREVIYSRRRDVLNCLSEPAGRKETILQALNDEINQIVSTHTSGEKEDQWNLDEIYESVDSIFSIPLQARLKLESFRQEASTVSSTAATRNAITEHLQKMLQEAYTKLEKEVNETPAGREAQSQNQNLMRLVERAVELRVIDTLWIEHLDLMDHLRQGIGLRGYGQRDPLVEYKKESYLLFSQLLGTIRSQLVHTIFKARVSQSMVEQQQAQSKNLTLSAPAKEASESNFTSAPQVSQSSTNPYANQKIGRNDPCPCGSGKKYKKCHGA